MSSLVTVVVVVVVVVVSVVRVPLPLVSVEVTVSDFCDAGGTQANGVRRAGFFSVRKGRREGRKTER